MKLISLVAALVFFLEHVFATDSASSNSGAYHTFHFENGGLKFQYPFMHIERTHCIDIQEEGTRMSYVNMAYGALNNPDILREETKLPIKLKRVFLPSLVMAASDDEAQNDDMANTQGTTSMLGHSSGYINCAFTRSRVQYFTSYPHHSLNKVHLRASIEKPSLSPFEAAVEAPFSVELSTRFHAKLFSYELPPIDFCVKLSVLVRAQAALCLLPEAKFAHRNNAAHVHLQTLETELLGFQWTAPSHGHLMNLILCFIGFWITILTRCCLYFRLFNLNRVSDLINEAMINVAKFEPFTVAEDYELIPMQAIVAEKEIIEVDQDALFNLSTPDFEEEANYMDSMF